MALPDMDSAFEIMQDAAFDATLWPEALQTISDSVGAAGALLIQLPDHLCDVRSPSLEEMMEFYYRNELYRHDVRVARGLDRSLRNGIVVDQDFISEDEARRHPYYQEFLHRWGRRWFAGLTVKVGGSILALSILRTSAQGPFIKREQEQLLTMRQKFFDNVQISRAVSQARSRGYLDGLQLLDQPAALLDAMGKVIDLNNCLRELLGPDLNVIRKRFRCVDSAAQRDLDAAITLATTHDPRRRGAAVGRASIPYGERSNLNVTVVPYAQGPATFFGAARAVALFKDPTFRRIPSVKELMTMFGMTRSEAQLAVALVRTSSLRAAADECELTWGSARQYMSAIYQKTGTSGQVELVALMAAGPATRL
jgi:DNA-binding CsgD family transcriptional regulator